MALDILNKEYDALKNKKLFLFDMDGTIYLDNTLFSGVKEVFGKISENGGRYVFITNNSSKSVNAYIDKLATLGIKTEKQDFFTSTEASVMLIKEKGFAKIYAQGTKSFIDFLRQENLNVTEEYDESVECIIVGFDSELDFEKEKRTCKLLTNIDVPYFATNPDWVCPVDFGYVPDCGSMCFAYEKATGKKPFFIGKPNPSMIFAVMEKFGVKREDTLVIGDRLYTDIASGVNAGVDTLFVLSGEGTMKDYSESISKPTYVLNGVCDLLKVL